MEGRKKFPLETAFVLILAALGLIIIIVSLGYGFGTFRRPGPGLYPFFIGLCVFGFSAALAISQLRSWAPVSLFGRGQVKTFLLMVATFSLWIVVMPLLGYVVVTLLITYAFCKIMMLEGWRKPLAVAAGTALFIYLLFDVWLYIDLPRGILG
jgi:putative tricarboxylic transport membrane protein